MSNLAWGAAVILFPNALFDSRGTARPIYLKIRQCVGVVVGALGIDYLIAAGNLRRHWPILLVGLLGKVLGPIGFAGAHADGTFLPALGLTVLTNALVGRTPFALIHPDAARQGSGDKA